ncbi:hypothetical protein J2787_002882 [Chryseobacterium rhizosphaerae]|uniref:Uncharacterized protein n=1 Tax=Chryseobacterium rhizosphaerae TaxID=395937 RepID=A0AAE3YBN6_9FLAO|nr:hypothetical protein [Chryseobacterium rhizosphaerae]MDR6527490.1 hypothetical protein [Chryseobacterium rhizosphaerae]
MSTIVEIIIKNKNSYRIYNPSIDTIETNTTFLRVIFFDNFNIRAKKTLNIETVSAKELIFVLPRRIGGKKIIHAKAMK